MAPSAPAAVRRQYEMARRRCRTLSAVRVLDYLYWCFRRFSGRPSPSQAQIAAGTGYCVRTVGRAVAELEGAGVLTVWRDTPHKREDGTFTRARTNLYRLRWPKPLVAPSGHSCHVQAPLRALVPAGASKRAAGERGARRPVPLAPLLPGARPCHPNYLVLYDLPADPTAG